MRPPAAPRTTTVSARPLSGSAAALAGVVLCVAAAGCGKSLPVEGQGRGAAVTTVAGAGTLAASGVSTKNTTRLGGADPIADAAAVALAVDPGLTPTTRPAAVTLVDARDWPVALAASALAGAPLGAPLLYAEGDSLPAISSQALSALRPRGTPLLGGAQVIEIGTTAAPGAYRTRSLPVPPPSATPGTSTAASTPAAAGPSAALNASAALAARIERLVALVRGAAPRRVIVIGAEGPPALAMPAAGLAAESGAPILPVGAQGIPPATRRVLAGLRRPAIYVVGPSAAVSESVLAQLGRYGAVRRIAPEAQTVGVASGGAPANGAVATNGAPAAGVAQPESASEEAVANAIAVSRYSDGPFGWGVEEPGHGLVFANVSRPLDAPAAAPLSASGDYGPLLLLEGPTGVPAALAKYLSDIQPSFPEYEPARGFYNHGWLIGDGSAISARTQAELDTMLEALPRGGGER